MAVAWKPLFSLILVSTLIIYEEWVSSPSCETPIPSKPEPDLSEEDLKVMLVANLLLTGSDSYNPNRIFRDHYTARFFTKAFQKLEPDMLVVLGDVSARGSELTKAKWLAVVRQFRGLLGPLAALPLHAVLGDRDIGRCGELGAKAVDWIAARFPGLDAAGCGAFEIGNVSFVSLNSVALLCGVNDLRFGVERMVERESLELRPERPQEEAIGEGRGIVWRESGAASGSGPVVLLHFPLHRSPACPLKSGEDLDAFEGRGVVGDEPHAMMQSLPANATEYILQALKPRIVFSGHSHEFSTYTHSDGTYEVAVPATTWNARDDPAFLVAIFRRNKKVVSIIYCTLSRESRVIMVYVSVVTLLALIFVLMKMHELLCSR